MGSYYIIANYSLKEYLQPNCKWGELSGNWNMINLLFRLLDGTKADTWKDRELGPIDMENLNGRWCNCNIHVTYDFEGDGYYDKWKKIEIGHEDYKWSGIMKLLEERLEKRKTDQIVFQPDPYTASIISELKFLIEEVKRRGID